jgi:hypothetical protein
MRARTREKRSRIRILIPTKERDLQFRLGSKHVCPPKYEPITFVTYVPVTSQTTILL